jgi:hypothetical protein
MLATKTNIRNQTKPKRGFHTIKIRMGGWRGHVGKPNSDPRGKKRATGIPIQESEKNGNRNVIARKEVYRLSIQSTKAQKHQCTG